MPDEEIFVNRIGSAVTLTPVSKMGESFMQALGLFTDDFMQDGRAPQVDTEKDTL